MIVRELVATLGLDFVSDGFEKAKKAFDELEHKAAAFAGVVAGGIVALAGLTVSTAEHARKIELLSNQLGIGVEDFQRLAHAASVTHVGIDEIAGAMQGLQEKLLQATRTGTMFGGVSDEMNWQFRRLGISLHGANGKVATSTQAIMQLADRLKAMKNPADRANAAMAILGSTGVKMLPTLIKGADGIRELAKESDEMGITIREGAVQAFSKFSESLVRLKNNFVGFGYQMAIRFLPSLRAIVDGISEWYVQHRELIKVISGYAVQAFGHALETAGFAIRGILDGLDLLFSTLKSIHPSLVVFAALAAIIGISLASPLVGVLALSAAILGLVDDIVVFAKGGKSITGDLLDWAGGLLGVAHAAEKVRKALSGGIGEELADQYEKLKEAASETFGGKPAKTAKEKQQDALSTLAKGIKQHEEEGAQPSKRKESAERETDTERPSRRLGELVSPPSRRIGELVGGGAESPQAAARLATGAPSTTNNTAGDSRKQVTASQTNHITVHAPQGMSPEELGDQVARKVSEHWQQQMQDAHAAMTDGVAAGVGG